MTPSCTTQISVTNNRINNKTRNLETFMSFLFKTLGIYFASFGRENLGVYLSEYGTKLLKVNLVPRVSHLLPAPLSLLCRSRGWEEEVRRWGRGC